MSAWEWFIAMVFGSLLGLALAAITDAVKPLMWLRREVKRGEKKVGRKE